MILPAEPNNVGFLGTVHCICQEKDPARYVGAMLVYRTACVLVTDRRLMRSSWAEVAANLLSYMDDLQCLHQQIAVLGLDFLQRDISFSDNLDCYLQALSEVRQFSCTNYTGLLRNHIKSIDCTLNNGETWRLTGSKDALRQLAEWFESILP